jgi:hypothetical protein
MVVGQVSQFSNADKAKEADREVKMREHVFGKRVAAGSMRPQDADRKIAIMREIGADYRALAEEEAKKERLL